MDRLRIDKWLWAARFYKTRSLATDEIDKGRVAINGVDAKPAREVKVGDQVAMRREGVTRTVVVRGLSDVRGPAPVAQQLYEGMEIGTEGATGLITYMRTDSPRISNEAIADARQVIQDRFGAEYLPSTPNVYKTQKAAQEAHEAIRPTSAARGPCG